MVRLTCETCIQRILIGRGMDPTERKGSLDVPEHTAELLRALYHAEAGESAKGTTEAIARQLGIDISTPLRVSNRRDAYERIVAVTAEEWERCKVSLALRGMR
jgi:hypothetical protein